MTKPCTIQVGDRVAYSVKFLKNTGQRTGWAPFARGTVLSLEPFGAPERRLVEIKWDDVAESKRVLDCNLTTVKRIGIDSALNM